MPEKQQLTVSKADSDKCIFEEFTRCTIAGSCLCESVMHQQCTMYSPRKNCVDCDERRSDAEI